MDDDILRRAYTLLDSDDETLRPRPAAGAEWRLPEPEPVRRSAVPALTAGDVLAAIEAGLEAERRAMRAHVSKRLNEFAALIGEEVARRESELRREHRDAQSRLLMRVAELESQLAGRLVTPVAGEEARHARLIN